MYRFMLIFHIVISCLFMLVAIALTTRSITGWLKNFSYSKKDTYLALLFLIFLYITLVNGVIMYFFIDPALKSTTDIHFAMKRASLRFWVVEHFYFMTFALVLSQIGGIFIRKTTNNKSRFMYSTFYYGVATLITIISVGFYLIYR
jgi:hypothetical protein